MKEPNYPRTIDNQQDEAIMTLERMSIKNQKILLALITPNEENHKLHGLFFKDTRQLLENYHAIKVDSYQDRHDRLKEYLDDIIGCQEYPSYLDLLEHETIFNNFTKRKRETSEEDLAVVLDFVARIETALKDLEKKENPIYTEVLQVCYLNPETSILTRKEQSEILNLSVSGLRERLIVAIEKYSMCLWGPNGEYHRIKFAETCILQQT